MPIRRRGAPLAGDIGAPSAENADFIVIQTHLSLGLAAALPQLARPSSLRGELHSLPPALRRHRRSVNFRRPPF